MLTNLRLAVKCGRLLLLAAAVGILAGLQMFGGQVQAEQGKAVESSSVTTDNDSVDVEAHHHYQSAADRASDALLKTEVKSALADDGIAEGSPIVVDCDHGKILSSGVLKSAEDAKRAENIAARSPGVLAVKNQLTWKQEPGHRDR
jgi:osmotically-inducible protein OsmY